MKNKVGRIILLLGLSIGLGACEKSPDPPAGEARKQPVVVYIAFEDDAELRKQLDDYTAQTGVVVISRRGGAESIVDDIIEDTISPSADVLLTQSVTEVWRAAEEGALRPIAAEQLAASVPAWARDADNLWAATGMTTAAIVAATASDIDDTMTFAELAETRFAGELCVSRFGEKINQVVIASLIDEVGVRPAELIVRGWIKNLAEPPFESNELMFDAISAGTCRFGIATPGGAGQAGLSAHVPSPAIADISGIGIARHASNPEGALALVEWILSGLPPAMFAEIDADMQKNVGVIAWRRHDAVLLAERAQYR